MKFNLNIHSQVLAIQGAGITYTMFLPFVFARTQILFSGCPSKYECIFKFTASVKILQGLQVAHAAVTKR